MFLCQPGICQFTLLNFPALLVISFYDVSSVEKLLPVLNPENFKIFENLTFSLVGQAVSKGVLRQAVSALTHFTSMFNFRDLLKSQKTRGKMG